MRVGPTIKLNREHLAKVLDAREFYLDAKHRDFTIGQTTKKRGITK
jgi:hypothetical protein